MISTLDTVDERAYAFERRISEGQIDPFLYCNQETKRFLQFVCQQVVENLSIME